MYFFTPLLPTTPELKMQFDELVLKYADINRYLYITSLQKLLSSIEGNQQKEFIMALENSEQLAYNWLKAKPELVVTLTEHLERSILASHTQLL
jgi:hypothetical protein